MTTRRHRTAMSRLARLEAASGVLPRGIGMPEQIETMADVDAASLALTDALRAGSITESTYVRFADAVDRQAALVCLGAQLSACSERRDGDSMEDIRGCIAAGTSTSAQLLRGQLSPERHRALMDGIERRLGVIAGRAVVAHADQVTGRLGRNASPGGLTAADFAPGGSV